MVFDIILVSVLGMLVGFVLWKHLEIKTFIEALKVSMESGMTIKDFLIEQDEI